MSQCGRSPMLLQQVRICPVVRQPASPVTHYIIIFPQHWCLHQRSRGLYLSAMSERSLRSRIHLPTILQRCKSQRIPILPYTVSFSLIFATIIIISIRFAVFQRAALKCFSYEYPYSHSFSNWCTQWCTFCRWSFRDWRCSSDWIGSGRI